ncbi:MAG: ATP-binding protein, partial [Saprospiraceae bacterium]
NYSSADGIHGKSFACGLKTKDGQFVFGGDDLIRFRPDDIKSGSSPPIISIDDIKVSNHSILNNLDSLNNYTTITLKHNQNNISIDYLGAHYTDPKSNKYAYILQNFDQEWNEVGSQRIAYYTNLPPGSYTFKVRSANSNGTWTETPASIHIHILPPWWKTPWAYGIYLIVLFGIGSLLNQYFKQRILKQQREQSQLKELEQAKEIEKAYKELEKSHEQLKSTQSQLVQAEKMASLGELTAGIAHEIQNPLNFVNNFSDINMELIGEMKDELSADHKQEAIDIADTIQSNLEKITTHGRRADSIVKNMLQHSRKSNGAKEPTDINALADEYLRLAYHGLRAKDKSFNALFKTDLDPAVGEVDAIPQDIGRVLLNLFTNAFHAVTEEDKARKEIDPDSTYKPVVKVSTKRLIENKQDLIEIKVSDNGPGIPPNIKDKIFQPFFTTKPTGQGTGLGLSLAYDIIKAHHGTIAVNSQFGRSGEDVHGTEFVINLPLN